ncbi:hypothetical protein [Corynebacterium diphtheriae]|uniref:hypothetical protein n=1 Tax=Corynebacterium diphtheriae TaxID=1717 RepID=UPI0005A0D7E3|nr:hypothetical protein [Corynebacterium diphtheriae]
MMMNMMLSYGRQRVPWLVNNMMVIVSCCVGGHCYFPRQGMMKSLIFILPVANNVVLLWWFLASWLDSFQLEELVDAL